MDHAPGRDPVPARRSGQRRLHRHQRSAAHHRRHCRRARAERGRRGRDARRDGAALRRAALGHRPRGARFAARAASGRGVPSPHRAPADRPAADRAPPGRAPAPLDRSPRARATGVVRTRRRSRPSDAHLPTQPSVRATARRRARRPRRDAPPRCPRASIARSTATGSRGCAESDAAGRAARRVAERAGAARIASWCTRPRRWLALDRARGAPGRSRAVRRRCRPATPDALETRARSRRAARAARAGAASRASSSCASACASALPQAPGGVPRPVREVDAHYHVGMDSPADFARLARCLAGDRRSGSCSAAAGRAASRTWACCARSPKPACRSTGWAAPASVRSSPRSSRSGVPPDEALERCRSTSSALKDPTLPLVVAARRPPHSRPARRGVRRARDRGPAAAVSLRLDQPLARGAGRARARPARRARCARASALPGILPRAMTCTSLRLSSRLSHRDVNRSYHRAQPEQTAQQAIGPTRTGLRRIHTRSSPSTQRTG